jgi:hypothetical protein
MVVNLAERTPFSKLLTTAQKPKMSFQLKAQGPNVPCQNLKLPHETPSQREGSISHTEGIMRNIGGRTLGTIE